MTANGRSLSGREIIGLAAVLVLAAALRLPGLAERGQFDADQGHDMHVLTDFTREGVVPLLGPKTSVGEFHHGAFYYFLLAPAAAVSNDDPVVVTGWLALLGIGAVALTWWFARSIAGPLAGFLAALLLALSPAGIEESTFIWNPNPIPFFATLALAAAWRGRETRRARWWALAVAAAGAVVQLHVLGLVFFVAVLVFAVLEVRRSRPALRGVVGGLAMVALLFVPLAIHEWTTGFLETRGVLDYLASGEAANRDVLSALVFTLLRVVGWPIVGLVTDVPALAALVLAALVALAAWRVRFAAGPERIALTWLLALLAWSVVALALFAPGLQTVVAGLPNDHYHAFLDPVVAVVFGVGIAALLERGLAAWRARTGRRTSISAAGPDLLAGAIGLVALAGILALEVARVPGADPNGGWAAADAAGTRIVAIVNGAPVSLFGLPSYKLPDAIGFPVERAGGTIAEHVDLMGFPEKTDVIVVACDRLFEGPMGASCGGPAESAFLATLPEIAAGNAAVGLVERFDASPRTVVSIYRPVVTP